MKSVASRRRIEQGASLGQLARGISFAGAVLVPAIASEPVPEDARVDGMLAELLTTRYARRVIEHAAMARATEPGFRALAPIHLGIAVVRLRLPRAHGARQWVAATILEETLRTNDFTRLADNAKLDAPIARRTIGATGPYRMAALPRFENLVLAQAQGEADRIAALEAGAQLSATWEELHLLHSLTESMGRGIAPADFARLTLAETRRTLSCRWTALRIDSALASIVGLQPGRLLVDGDDGGLAETVLREGDSIAAPAIVDPQLVVAPLGQDGTHFGAIAAGGLVGPDGRENASGMSSVERTLVGTAAGNVAVVIENARLARDRDQLFFGALKALVRTIDAKDRYTRGHSERVSLLSRQIATAAGLSDRAIQDIATAGRVHDIGKIAVPESVLCKHGRLTDEEYAIIKQHPERGYEILRDIPDSKTILEGVLHHHESYDGTGYPHRLAGDAIPVAARIIAIADTFDAMSSTRTYRRALPRAEVLTEMVRLAGRQFDPRYLEAFLRIDLSEYDAQVRRHMEHPTGASMEEPMEPSAVLSTEPSTRYSTREAIMPASDDPTAISARSRSTPTIRATGDAPLVRGDGETRSIEHPARHGAGRREAA